MTTKLNNACTHREYRDWLMRELDVAARDPIRARRALSAKSRRWARKRTNKRATLAKRLKVARTSFWLAWLRLPENHYDRAGAYAYLARLSAEEESQARAKWLSAGPLIPTYFTQGRAKEDQDDQKSEQEAGQAARNRTALEGGDGS